jgi:hypothetical protein
MEYPKNQLDALTNALVLSVTAPSESKSKAALELAESLTAGLSYADVEFCKREAEKLLNTYEDPMNRSIHTIACDIQNDMDHLANTAKKPVHWTEKYPYAVPYVSAMLTMHKISDSYYLDSGREIVQRFLCNASQWRGEKAKAIKLELKSML